MSTLNKFTDEQNRKLEQLNASFVERANKNAGQILNEDSFEKAGLFDKLRESPDFLEEFQKRAEKKVGNRPK